MTPAAMGGGSSDVLEMALMGIDTSLIAPALVLAFRSWPGWRVLSWPAAVALPVFLLAHAGITVAMALVMPGTAMDLGFQVALVAVSVLFWLPVLGPQRSLSEAGRSVYLFLAMPTMDLAGVFVVLRGDSAGGLAMIVAMLPVGIAAVTSTWRWMEREDAAGTLSPVPPRFAAMATGTRLQRGS